MSSMILCIIHRIYSGDVWWSSFKVESISITSLQIQIDFDLSMFLVVTIKPLLSYVCSVCKKFINNIANMAPRTCAITKNKMKSGCIPVKVLLNPLAIVTAGLAKDVEEVNQIADVIYNPTAGATTGTSNFLVPSIVINRPKVAINSPK